MQLDLVKEHGNSKDRDRNRHGCHRRAQPCATQLDNGKPSQSPMQERARYRSSRSISSRNSSSMPDTVDRTSVAGAPLFNLPSSDWKSSWASRASREEIAGETLFQLERAC